MMTMRRSRPKGEQVENEKVEKVKLMDGEVEDHKV